MEQLEIVFDKKRIQTVAIERVQPNSWNPKDIDTNEYQHVLLSLQKKGLRQPIIVREIDDHFQIIDGEQRWRGWKELGKHEILIYNEGPDISDQEAKELTISYQQQVPFIEIEFAKLLQEMTIEYENLELPIEDNEIQSLIAALDYDGGQLSDELWEDMPEFEQEDIEVYQKIIVRFASIEDVENFAALVERKITPKTKYLNFPKLSEQKGQQASQHLYITSEDRE
jgi:ParB/RepB/Spo0J family partition protein